MDNYTKMNREINDLAKKLSKIDKTEAREKLTFFGPKKRGSNLSASARENIWLRSGGF